MNRRGFLKGIAAGIVMASPAARAISELPSNTVVYTPKILADYPTLSDGMFVINIDARTIAFTEAAVERGVTGQELYSYLKEAWKDDLELLKEPFPMMGITPEYFQMQYDWSMDWANAQAFRCGMIEECNGDRYAAMIGLGMWDAGNLQLARNDLPRLEEVDQNSHVVRLRPGDEKLTWHSFRKPDIPCPGPDWEPDDTQTFNSTENLGYTNIYEQACGSIRFPKPFGFQWRPRESGFVWRAS